MKYLIALQDKNNAKITNDFKKYIERQPIQGISEFSQVRSESKDGEMSTGKLLNVFSIVLEKLNNPLVEVIKCISNYANLFKTSFTFEKPDGEKLVIDGKLSEEALIKLIKEFKSK